MKKLRHPTPTMLSIQKWQFSMSAIKEEQELMEEMNEDEPVKAKKWKTIIKTLIQRKKLPWKLKLKLPEKGHCPSGGPNEAVQGHAARERGVCFFNMGEGVAQDSF